MMQLDPANLHWYWFTAGVLLIAAEAVVPGAVLLWFGVSAILTGLISWGADWSLNAQLMFFSVMAISCTVAFKLWLKANPPPPPEEDAAAHLNHAGENLIGRKLRLVTPIEDGVGRVKVADSSWRCRGPELPQGSEVEVIDVEAGTLIVQAAEKG